MLITGSHYYHVPPKEWDHAAGRLSTASCCAHVGDLFAFAGPGTQQRRMLRVATVTEIASYFRQIFSPKSRIDKGREVNSLTGSNATQQGYT